MPGDRFEFGGYVPDESNDSPWPPSRPIGYSPRNLFKRIHARLSGGKLVWLRDYDEIQTLAVAYEEDGELRAKRIWPFYAEVVLNEDGTVTTERNKFVRHWIWADDAPKVFMLMQNSETYAEPIKE